MDPGSQKRDLGQLAFIGRVVWPASGRLVLWFPTLPQTARKDGARGYCGIGSDEKQPQVPATAGRLSTPLRSAQDDNLFLEDAVTRAVFEFRPPA